MAKKNQLATIGATDSHKQAIAKFTKSKTYRKQRHNRTSTTGKALEDKRIEFENKVMLMNACTDKSLQAMALIQKLEGEAEPDREKIIAANAELGRWMNQSQLVMMSGHLEGFALLADCLTYRQVGTVNQIDPKTGEEIEVAAFKRHTIASLLGVVDEEENTLHSIARIMDNTDIAVTFLATALSEISIPMVSEIGNKLIGGFQDHRGTKDPEKYTRQLEEEDENGKKPVAKKKTAWSKDEANVETAADRVKPMSAAEFKKQMGV